MTSLDSDVRRALASEHAQATETLTNAFASDPILSWMIGGGRDTMQRGRHLFGHVLKTEFAGSDHLVDIAGDGHAVALWHEVDDWKASPIEVLKMFPAAVKTFGRRLPVALHASLKIERAHPREPHRYLGFIGVHPSQQGRGLGGALLAAMTEECDAQGLGAYLESSNPSNNALYHGYGFVSLGPIDLPRGAPIITSMWRAPR